MNMKFATARGLVVAAAIAAGTAAAGGTASADPGFCGVRNGESVSGSGGSPTYFVRNKCGHDWKFKVHTKYRSSNCKVVPAGEVVGYIVYGLPDFNWTIENC